MKNGVYGFLLALQFLTRIPVSLECPWNKETSRWALRCYPVAGLILSSILVMLVLFLHTYLPLWVLAFLVLTVWIWLTGGLHLDGWMDVGDAIGSNAPLEKKWEIMKDPRVGSFGILSLLFLLTWKTIFIYLLLESSYLHLFTLFIILAFSRFLAVVLMYFYPTAQQNGLAWEWKQNLTKVDVIIAFIPIAVLFILMPTYLLLLPAYLLFGLIFGRWMMKTFKGSNGDLMGTAIEGGELWGLAIVWISISFVTG
ncbi:adenosylcobinamide-GDP ribazoletransferase [Sutcliffiella rhizosphaerae]|uniref:Adenosylcobinamide-GDP ribazoletransferase n=1 Tax=Sutcliffiella rhizosphaerae TaxID=2880967 RepID=A0ABM8YKE1_9BACI|nr:adenosylcobinamide-GDP ribazoletransferase [Sutcliffiella rhizosphaerae]CAG9620230.1 Adenosylcobinamide-GDP ribazoletransferase [Sutcliffiella rhizosphaerae]